LVFNFYNLIFFVFDFLGKYFYVGKSKKMREKCAGGGETF